MTECNEAALSLCVIAALGCLIVGFLLGWRARDEHTP